MPQFNSQFAVIQKIKSFVKKTGSFFAGSDVITSAIARKIQKTAFEVSRMPEKDECTAPYLSIAEELQSNDVQIFKAAVFYLSDIAVNEARYAEAIVEILRKNKESLKGDVEKSQYIDEKLKYISDNCSARK